MEASSRPAVGTSYAPLRSSLVEIHPNRSSTEDSFRLPPYPPSHRPSMISNLSCTATSTLANNCRSRSHSKAESISTLWSSADVPLFLDTSMERVESSGSHPHFTGLRNISAQLTPLRSPSNGFQENPDEYEEREELNTIGIMMDEPISVSSPRSSDIDQSGTSRRESHRQQMRPPPLNLHRESATSNVPTSVSISSSHIVMPVQNTAININKQLPPSPPPHLYQEAEKYFSLSYTMTPPPSATSSAPSFDVSQQQHSQQYDEDSQQSPVKALSPSYSYSRDSRSSTDSSSVLPDADSFNNRLCTAGTMTKSISNDAMPSSPLRVAVGLTADRAMSRHHTSLATLTADSPRSKSPAMSSAHRTSEAKEEDESKYPFLHSPAPSIGRKASLSGKKTSLFNAKLRTVSTPKLRAEKESGDVQETNREQREASRAYPPQAPSGRFRSRTLGESDLGESLQGVNTSTAPTPRTSQDSTSQRQPRRPSSSDALSAMAARLRRPSKTVTISSSHYNSSVTSINNLNEAYEAAPSRVDRAYSSTSSQFFVEPASTRSPIISTFLKKAASSTAMQTKSKGGWASHLTQGLTLHIEQGSKRYAIKMNYLTYDPFGKPESLCEDRPVTPARPKSKSGEEMSSNDSVGLLEFDPQIETEGSTSADRLTLDATSDAPILKHLVIGDDVKGDLITRQANLSLCDVGTREVSGSERKGKVTWRFIYSVEDCRLDSGEVVDGMKTLRPLSFTCSATLLDPSRAKKSRVINIIRKQIGSHIESMPMSMSVRSASVASSTYLQSLPALASPTSSQSSSYHSSPNQRTYSPVTSSAPGHSPSRTGLTPFKMTKSTIEAVAGRNPQSSEQSSANSLAPSSPRGAHSYLTRKSSLLPSPLSCHFPAQSSRDGHRSPGYHARDVAGGHLLAPHHIKTRPRGASVGQTSVEASATEVSGALGLDIGETSTPRRVRSVTSHVESSRPSTASEEIKQAYLMQSSLMNLDSMPTTPSQLQQNQSHTSISIHDDESQSHSQTHQQYFNHQQNSHRSRRPSNTTHFTIVSQTRQQPVSPIALNRPRRREISTTAGPPEGPFWL